MPDTCPSADPACPHPMDPRRGDNLSPMFAAFLCWLLRLQPMTRPAITGIAVSGSCVLAATTDDPFFDIREECLQTGTINYTPVYPRQVCIRALEVGAAAMVKHYPYPQSIEADIIRSMQGRIYGRYHASRRDTDIEHIVALSEAHDSGMCAASRSLRRQFAADPLNLTLAAPDVNRCYTRGKCGYDAAEWQPPMNKCWFAARVIAVKRKYALTADAAEARALRHILASCSSNRMVFTKP